jgi:hypothetical protein
MNFQKHPGRAFKLTVETHPGEDRACALSIVAHQHHAHSWKRSHTIADGIAFDPDFTSSTPQSIEQGNRYSPVKIFS